jgi:uncharacterized protein
VPLLACPAVYGRNSQKTLLGKPAVAPFFNGLLNRSHGSRRVQCDLHSMTLLHCPICQRPFQPDESPAMPFCSQRCRLTDLGRWLDERHGLPIEREEQEGEQQPRETDADEG